MGQVQRGGVALDTAHGRAGAAIPADHLDAKAAAACALRLRCPPQSVARSVDGKTTMQASSRSHLDRRPRPGDTENRELERIDVALCPVVGSVMTANPVVQASLSANLVALRPDAFGPGRSSVRGE